MTRVLTILAAVAALAVSAAPVASAGSSKGKPRQAAVLYNGHAGLGANARADGDIAKRIVTDNKDPDKLGAARTRGAQVISSLGVKYT